jgi:hypothetical protein
VALPGLCHPKSGERLDRCVPDRSVSSWLPPQRAAPRR